MEKGRPSNGRISHQLTQVQMHVKYKGKMFNTDELRKIILEEKEYERLKEERDQAIELTLEGIRHRNDVVHDFLRIRKHLADVYCPEIRSHEDSLELAEKEKRYIEGQMRLTNRESLIEKYMIRIKRAEARIIKYESKIKKLEERYFYYDKARDPFEIDRNRMRVKRVKKCAEDILLGWMAHS